MMRILFIFIFIFLSIFSCLKTEYYTFYDRFEKEFNEIEENLESQDDTQVTKHILRFIITNESELDMILCTLLKNGYVFNKYTYYVILNGEKIDLDTALRERAKYGFVFSRSKQYYCRFEFFKESLSKQFIVYVDYDL